MVNEVHIVERTIWSITAINVNVQLVLQHIIYGFESCPVSEDFIPSARGYILWGDADSLGIVH